MIQEQKELLIKKKDLCARLPYSVQVEIEGYRSGVLKGIDGDTISTDTGINYPLRLVKPYLRPMSSMTEEEYEELKSVEPYYGLAPFKYIEDWCPNSEVLDWLNKKGFDYRGLIPMGLALPAPEGMYKELKL